MKTRTGFVSNSSSSSFVVPIRKIEIINRGGNLVVSTDKLQKLLKYGFKPTVYSTPSMLENSSMCMRSIEVVPLENAEALAYQVGCNELDVIAELLRLDVSFQASCHYGHESVFHKTGSTEVWFIANPGVECEMYGLDALQNDIKSFEDDPRWNPLQRSPYRCESVASVLAEEELIDKRCNSIQDEDE
jgi:hypothetical protein